ncbi:MAG: polyprenyl synthetase family protein [Acidobacteria bacterium]|nr:polyprenyl synthetase family protein [Acidobacteriota bacterium]
MRDLNKFFDHCSRRVDARLDALIPAENTPPARLYAALRWSVFAGGKRFRPALTLAAGRVFGAPEERLLSTAAAIEMIHTYSLIHDDLPAMDDDELRRGRATCHVKFDEATAILAGDQLQTLAFHAIANDAQLTESTRLKLIAELAEAAARMVDGQQLDLDAEGRRISLEDLEKIHRSKTGAMIRVAARAGALIAGAGDDELCAVTLYAEKLGLLFQITDDLLDVTQTTEVLGKTAGKDVTAEKATYPHFHGLAETRRLAAQVHAEAAESLKTIDKNTDILAALLDFILAREK